jgi:hypothetical protein
VICVLVDPQLFFLDHVRVLEDDVTALHAGQGSDVMRV